MNIRCILKMARQLAVWATLVFLVTLARADFPAYLAVNGHLMATALNTSPYSGSDENGPFQMYWTLDGAPSSVILHGANGGGADWINDGGSTYNGSWDGAFGLSVPYVASFIPQLVVALDSSSNATLNGFNSTGIAPALGQAMGDYATVYAYTGLTTGCIFSVAGSPVYRYTPDVTTAFLNGIGNAWPASNFSSSPAQVYINNELFTQTSRSEGISGSYYCLVTYSSQSGGYLTLNSSISPQAGALGQFYGTAGGVSFYEYWEPLSGTFPPLDNIGIAVSFVPFAPWTGVTRVATVGGVVLPFLYQDSNGADVYGTPGSGSLVSITPTGSVNATVNWLGDTGTYDGNLQHFQMNNGLPLAVVSSDGNDLVGLPDGITVISDVMPEALTAGWGSDTPTPDYVLQRADGRMLGKFTSRLVTGLYVSIDGSPFYQYTGGNMSIEHSDQDGWSESNVPMAPRSFYVDGVIYESTGGYNYGGGSGFGAYVGYTSPSSEYAAIQFSYQNGQLTNGDCVIVLDGQYYFGGVDVSSHQTTGFGGLHISFDPFPAGQPTHGPPAISADLFGSSGPQLYSFISYDAAGRDCYAGPYSQLAINASGAVLQSFDGTNWTITGYVYSDGAFAGNVPVPFIALNTNGEPLGLPSGLTLQGGDAFGITSIALGDGTYRGCDYEYQRNDAIWGSRYVNLPDGTLFLIMGSDPTSYNSPVFRYRASRSHSFSVQRNSNLLPRVLWVNDHLATINNTTLTASGSGEMRSGGVSYVVQPTGETVRIDWTWSDGTETGVAKGFSAKVSGDLAPIGPFQGKWDGNAAFTQLPYGLVITLHQLKHVPSFGPARIRWNGQDYLFDPIASAGDSDGRDVYRDSNGTSLRIAIASNGDAVLYAANDTPIHGTYNASSHQFSFTGPNSGQVIALNEQGGTYSGGGPGPGTSGGTLGGTQQILGDVDILGDNLTLGSWLTSDGSSTNGFGLNFFQGSTSQPPTIGFAATRVKNQWVWSKSKTDGGTALAPSMKLDEKNRLILYKPADPAHPELPPVPTMIFDPAGKSYIEPQGDLSMGQFTNGQPPAQP